MDTEELNLLVIGARMYSYEGFDKYESMSPEMDTLLNEITYMYVSSDAEYTIRRVSVIDSLSVTQPDDIDDAVEHINLLKKDVGSVNHNTNMQLSEVVKRAGIGGDVYILTSNESLSDTKQMVIEDLHPSNQIILVDESSEVLDDCINLLGFKRVSDINLAPASLYDLDVSKSTRDEILGETSWLGDVTRGLKYKYEQWRA